MNQERLRRGSLPVFSEFSGGFSLGGFPIQPPWVDGCEPAVAPVLPELVTGFVDEAGHGVSRQGRLMVLWAPLRRSPSQATGFAGGI